MNARKIKRRRQRARCHWYGSWVGEYERRYKTEIDHAVAAICKEENELWMKLVKEKLEYEVDAFKV